MQSFTLALKYLWLLNKDDIFNYSHSDCKIDIELFLTESEQFNAKFDADDWIYICLARR